MGEDKWKLPAVGRVTPINTRSAGRRGSTPKDDPPFAHLHAAKSGRLPSTPKTINPMHVYLHVAKAVRNSHENNAGGFKTRLKRRLRLS
jgi:hypothetical protein